MDNEDENWIFQQDAEWSEVEGALAHAMLEGAAEMHAGSATLVGRNHGDLTVGMRSVTFVGEYEIAIDFDVRTGEVIWAYRHAPERCEACGHRVEEGAMHVDNEGVVLCDDCWPVALVDDD